MKINLKSFLLSFILLTSITISAQVGVGTSQPDSSSILDIYSESKGFLMPRLSTAQRDAMVLPATGLMIYNSTLNDGQLNIGTPADPKWAGIKEPEKTPVDTVTESADTSTSSTSELLVEGMTLSPLEGSYIVLFNAQMSNNVTFSSTQGVSDLTNVFDELMASPGAVSHALTFGNGEVLAPGVYDVAGAASIAGILIMDGGGDPNSIFIIRASGAFTTVAGATVVLTGNAQSENIFWVSDAAMSTAANTTMKGTMLGGGNGAGAVSLGINSNLEGRMFTKLGAVSLAAGVNLTTLTGNAPVNLGVLSTFAMWSSSGAVSDVATATTIGDVGTASAALTMVGIHTGQEYPAGTTSSAGITTYSVYQNGVEVASSSRTINLQSAVLSLQAKVNVTTGDSVEIWWKVNGGESTINNRTLSLICSQ
ncbi:hypothetical protein CW736_11975 [Nonlabens sp. MB-3u-79]|uniref:ice-binding family protein n=1 Tax=Nonlabens sp. MB-3u-79 TaxID=2058134 RepID=UPI000C31558A|nr:ice-binding family protein [Nonlabens sp. MB-3u-79]AUC80042.1 hypothetical protein CW736_11975 [Nonlabens sp. MB-3u-79]|tara:strand:- start:2687 stop:3955 length:1269 start_codon:yes stop_codon:yes gene_type:complete